MSPPLSLPPVRVVSKRTVKPSMPRPRSRIQLTSWDVAMLSINYIQKGLLFVAPPFTIDRLVDHLAAALADALTVYYSVAGRFVTDKHRRDGNPDVVVGCSVSVDCAGQGAEIIHAVADGVGVADVVPPDVDIPTRIVQSLFPLNDAVGYDGHELPLFAVQVTELSRDGAVFLGFACNHALADGTAFWNLVNAWAEIARARLAPPDALPTSSRSPPVFERWFPDGGMAAAVLPCADPSELVERLPPPAMRERMLRFSETSLAALKEHARRELFAAGDTAGVAALTRFQALTSLLWRSITSARRLLPEQETTCRAAINNRGRLRPPLPPEYFGNSIYAIATSPVRAADLLGSGHGWAASAVGRAAAWAAAPVVFTARMLDAASVLVGSSPRFDMYGCDFGWGKPVAVRSGRANKFEGKVSLYPGRDGGIDVEVTLLADHMAALEEDDELWAAVSPDETALAMSKD